MLYLKLVPDAEPNADGVWASVDGVPPDVRPFDLKPRTGYHVVATDVRDHRDGGPMHRMADPEPPAELHFNLSWLS